MRAAPRAPRGLEELERWFQGEILRPHEERAAQRPRRNAARHVLPSHTLAPEERVAIYSGMYLLRLLECMRIDFPAVEKLVGERRFEALVRAYLERHPSRHWSLNPLGKSFARFLERELPKLARRALLAEVARLEWTMQEVFEVESSKPLAPADLAGLAPESWSARRLVPSETLRLMAFEYRANAIATAVRREKPLPALTRQPSFVAVYRKEWTVWRMDLDRTQFTVLAALCKGRTLAQALVAGARVHRGSPEELQQKVRTCFAEWISEGFFRSVE